MHTKHFLWAAILSALFLAPAASAKPNIVYILADDQGWGDLGCYGSKDVQTPNMDRLATQGIRFTNCYCGSAVCAPERCTLMTGLHTGHARRRDNEAKGKKDSFEGRPLLPLEPGDLTIASVLHDAGYATGGFGKWGLGNPGTTGVPEKHGFDVFFGYYDQVHAHDYYTGYLIRNSRQVEIPENKNGRKGVYSHDRIAAESLKWIREQAQNKDRPFFAYLPYTIPHGNHVAPDDELLKMYADKPWPEVAKVYAAMLTRLDRTVGQILDLIKELGIEDNTIVFYASDNGATAEFARTLHSNGPFRGVKTQLYEGGLRCPMIVRWPGKTPVGKSSEFAWNQVDIFPTFCEIAGVQPPAGTKLDGISVLPAITGHDQQIDRKLYWEIYTPFQQAARWGNWKAIRFGTADPAELYDLSKDIGEQNNVAAQHPDVARELEAYMTSQHVDTPYWPTVEHGRGGAKKGGKGKKKATE